MNNPDLVAAALALHKLGLHVFPVDHPDQPDCIGAHATTPCDGTRGKHPACKWSTWAAAATDKMIDQAWARRGNLANIGIACGPSNLVVLDEDQAGELDRWCADNGITLPDTYEVTTGRGRHLYFRWDHNTQRIGNSPKATDGYKIDVRGYGGFAVGEGSRHVSGADYVGNGQPIAELPQKVADLLFAGVAQQPNPQPGPQLSWEQVATGPDADMIADGDRHKALIKYAGRLRKSGLDYSEAEILFRERWLLCEQPEGRIPEAQFHTATCRSVVEWNGDAVEKLRDAFGRYAAGNGAAQTSTNAGADKPKLWNAADLEPAAQLRWLAQGRIPYGVISLLVGDEGIGKSLFWVWIVAAISAGKPIPEFGIPQRPAGDVVIVCTEDDWRFIVRPRLEVADADLAHIRVICINKDGSGSPVFPRDLPLIMEADPKPVLVVVDAWLDTVPSNLKVKDPQDARLALHPWTVAATATGAAMMLLCHTNRVATGNPRDKYGITGELRKVARITLFAQKDDRDQLMVGPEKNNLGGDVLAAMFKVLSIPKFPPTADDDGTVPVLVYEGDSQNTAAQQFAEAHANSQGGRGDADAVTWLATYLADGPKWVSDIERVGATFSKSKLKTAKQKLKVASVYDGAAKQWFWRFPQHFTRTP